MKYLKLTLKYIGRILLGISGLLLLYFILAFLLSIIPKNPEPVTCSEKETVYLISNGIHLDIILKRSQLDEAFWQQLEIPKTAKYVAFGWGDKGFYLNTPNWNALKASTVVNALFLKSESAMHVTSYYAKREKFVALPLCNSQLETLKIHIESSFVKNEEEQILKVGKGYGRNDDFYEATGSYNGIKTCNEWVNQGLKKANVRTSIWSPLDRGVFYHLDSHD